MSALIEVQELGRQLAELMDRVRGGEEITIAEKGRPVARIVRIAPSPQRPEFGALKGSVEIADDFNAPLPVDELREWGK